MSGKKVTIKAAEPRSDSDKAKRVYRGVVETIRRLDEVVKQKRAYRDVFMSDAINLRCRLQEYCEWLIFSDPVEYGRKAEELLWRKAYYDVIQLMKHNKKQMRPSSSLESAFRTHLTAGTGFYHHLLCKLQAEYSLQLDGITDFCYLPNLRAYRKGQIRKGDPEPPVKEWAIRACHRCLVYLGDIARYQQDYDGMRSRVLAQRHYYQALALCPQIGMPHNQLGTLAGTRYYNFDAAYYYLRCLVCAVSFDGAHGNLLRLLEKNRRRYREIPPVSPRDLAPEQQRSKDLKRFLVKFLHLLDIFHGTKSKSSLDARGLQEACQNVLHDFNVIMFSLPPHVTRPSDSRETYAHDERMAYLEDEVVFKVIVMCMITVHLLQRDGNKCVTAAIAFSLALFSHVLNHTVIRLQSALSELEHPRRIIHIDNREENEVETSEQEDTQGTQSPNPMTNTVQVEQQTPNKRRQKVKKLRRRKRCLGGSSSSSGSGGILSEDESDLSEGEEHEEVDVGELSGHSDSEEEIGYLQRSSSDEDSEDNLMVSQELRPGFSGKGDGTDNDAVFGCNSLNSSLSSSFNSSLLRDLKMLNNEQNSRPVSAAPPMDVAELLKDFPVDMLDSTALFRGHFGNGESSDSDTDINAVAQGTKEVRVPPGFESSAESRYVSEITEKMVNFVIETDTDTSNFPTDTENSTITTESEMDTETETDQESVIDKSEIEQRRLERLLQVLGREGLLGCVKVYSDWMRCNTHIIATCAKSSQSLWTRLSVLLNFLPLETDLARLELCRSEGVLRMVESAVVRDWTPTQPLKEDLHLQEFPPLKDAHESLFFSPQKRLDMSLQQQTILRVCYLRRFGYSVAKLKSIRFLYDTDNHLFMGPTHLHPTSDTQTHVSKVDADARRQQLMRDMAQLRLQAEVSQLEGSLQSSQDVPSLPPYLVPDASALCNNLPQLKQLAQSARFIIIIPLTVIDHLDLLKKETGGARDSIRWLEGEFKKGNRYVRAQKNHEKTPSPLQKGLKKRDMEAWRFIQVVECSRYFAQQSSDTDGRGGMVCVLTRHHLAAPESSLRCKQVVSSAVQEGITIQDVPDFFTKWKATKA